MGLSVRIIVLALVSLAACSASASDWADGEWIRIEQDTTEGHDFLARWRRPAIPMWIQEGRDSDGFLHWHRLPGTFGGEIREFGEGPMGWVVNRLVEAAGSERWVDAGSGKTVGYGYDDLGDAQQARLTVDVSDRLVSIHASTLVNRFFGLWLGGWNLRGVTQDTSPAVDDVRTREILETTGGWYVSSGTWGLDVVLTPRLPVEVRWLGLLTLQLDAPVVYLLTGWMALSTPSALGLIYSLGGAPRLRVSWDRRLGPASLSVEGSVPTTYLVLPTRWSGAELVASAGFFF